MSYIWTFDSNGMLIREKQTPLAEQDLFSYRSIFHNFDMDGDGKLQYNEFHGLYALLARDKVDAAKTKELFNYTDKNKNGAVDFDEFLTVAPTLPPLADFIKGEFMYNDVNCDGFLDKDELYEAVKNLTIDHKLNQKVFDDLLKRVDVNQDGKVDMKEFIQLTVEVYKKGFK